MSECRIARPDASIAVRRTGHGQGVLFIQGVGVAGRAWQPQLDALSDGYDCIAYDHREVGASTGNIRDLDIDRLADDAVAILDALGIDRAHLVGHSMGGVVAQQVALDHPGRVISLSLLCTFARGRDATAPSWPMLRLGIPTLIGTRRVRARAMARLIAAPADIRRLGLAGVVDRIEAAFGRRLAQTPPVSRAQLRALSRHDTWGRLGELHSIPSLVISGTEDPIAPPAYGRRLASAIGARRYLELSDASHALTILQADEVNIALMRHLAASDPRVP